MEQINADMISERATQILNDARKIVRNSKEVNSPEEYLEGMIILAFRRVAELQLELEHMTNDPKMHTIIE